MAADLTTTRLKTIQKRCEVLQTTLDQLQRRDLVSRTDLGREYESINRQISAFILRMNNNGMNTATLSGPTSDYRNAVIAFREAYIRYDNSMNDLRDIDCRAHAGDFANTLDVTYVLRASVGAEVARAKDALDRYRKAMVTLQKELITR